MDQDSQDPTSPSRLPLLGSREDTWQPPPGTLMVADVAAAEDAVEADTATPAQQEIRDRPEVRAAREQSKALRESFRTGRQGIGAALMESGRADLERQKARVESGAAFVEDYRALPPHVQQQLANVPCDTAEAWMRSPQGRALMRAHRAAPRPRARGGATPTRTRGSRRAGASSSTSSADPGDGDSDPEPPPGLGLWRHPRWGRCTPSLLRALLRADREQVAS